MAESEVVIVGAGIVGLATAVACARDGKQITILDRHHVPTGASVRNFGMIWPIGQPLGLLHDTAMRSREIWLELADQIDFYCERSGSIHLAREQDELDVLNEFVHAEANYRDASLLSPEEVVQHAPGVNPQGMLGGMYSPHELNIESRTAVAKIWSWIEEQPNIKLVRGFEVARVRANRVESTQGEVINAGHIYFTAGHDGISHYPDLFPRDRFSLCKLQMMRTIPQPSNWKMGTHIAGGWTLRHYDSFSHCPSLPSLKERISIQYPDFDTHGIHIMLSQHASGDLVIGDSHTYGDDITPFDDEHIDRIILENAKHLVSAPTWKIDKRWHGIYLKRRDGNPLLVVHPEPGITILNAFGGAGMTLSFGVAERVVQSQGQETFERTLAEST